MSLTKAERETKHAAQKTLRDLRRKEGKAAKENRPKKVRPVAPGQRDPREKDKAYLQAIRTLPCIYCLIEGKLQPGRAAAAHVKCGYPGAAGRWRAFGAQEKSHDWRTLPACVDHHREGKDSQHAHKERDHYERWGIYPPNVCGMLRVADQCGADMEIALRTEGRELRRGLGA